VGDASKAKGKLGWEARTGFKDLVRLMVDEDMILAEKEAYTNGFADRSRNQDNVKK
jgi:GDPmannose 4,6-dehydratase